MILEKQYHTSRLSQRACCAKLASYRVALESWKNPAAHEKCEASQVSSFIRFKGLHVELQIYIMALDPALQLSHCKHGPRIGCSKIEG